METGAEIAKSVTKCRKRKKIIKQGWKRSESVAKDTSGIYIYN